MPTKTKGFKLTEDDKKILAYVYQFRAVTISHLMILTGRKSRRAVSHRLMQLVRNYYLFCNERRFQKYVYTLNNKAVSELVKAGIGSKEAIKKQVRNRKQSEYFIDHTLMGTDIHLALELASRVSPIKVADCRHEDKSLKDKVTIFEDGEQETLPVEPDKFITLLDTRRPEKNLFPIFWENDRGTTTDTKRFLRKTGGYNAFFEQKLHTKKYGVGTIFVLTIALEESHAVKLCDKTRDILPRKSRGFYYFTSISHFPLDNPAHVHEDILISPKDPGEGKAFEERKHYSLVPPLVSQSANR